MIPTVKLVVMVTNNALIRWGRNQKFLMKHKLLASDKIRNLSSDDCNNENICNVLVKRSRCSVNLGASCKNTNPTTNSSRPKNSRPDVLKSRDIFHDVLRSRHTSIQSHQGKKKQGNIGSGKSGSDLKQPSNQRKNSSITQPIKRKRYKSRDAERPTMRIITKPNYKEISSSSKIADVCPQDNIEVLYENGCVKDIKDAAGTANPSNCGDRENSLKSRSRKKRRSKSRDHKYQNIIPSRKR